MKTPSARAPFKGCGRSLVLAFAISTSFVAGTQAATITVVNTNNSLAGSLRQAVQDASPGDTIVFQIPTTDLGYNPTTGGWTISLTSGELLINKNLSIDGGGQKITIERSISAAITFRVFNITAGTVTFSALTIANGNLSGIGGFGGGILNDGVLSLERCTVTGNFSGNTLGGAIFSSNILIVRNCTFAANTAGTLGASGERGGAIYNTGTLNVTDSTFSGNQASSGCGIANLGTARLQSTIVVGNTNGSSLPADMEGAFISDGYNLIGNPSGATGFGATGDQVGATVAQANLSPLRDHGGPTRTIRPLPGSVAIDQGKRGLDAANQPLNIDQRGFARPVDFAAVPNAVGGDGSDIGAVETAPQQNGPTFTVTNTAEHSDASCTTDDCTLLEALNAANTNADANTVVFASGLGGVIAVPQPNGFSINTPINIRGPGARQLTIHGGDSAPIFVTSGTGASFSGLTLNGGRAQSNGGAFSNTGSLTVTDCTITNSRALNTAGGNGNGGGLYNAPGAAAAFERCTFFGNRAAGFGGGAIFNSGTLTLTNCTFVSNSAPAGGAILSTANNGNSLATLRNCTIAFNVATSTGTANSGGGGYYGEGAVGNTLHHFSNTILAANSNANNPDLRGYGTTEGNNLIGNLGQGGTGFTNGVNGDKVGVNPGLDSFANHGGPTDTESLLSTSPARDAGNDVLAPAIDQRHFTRSGVSDIGAYEFGGVAPASPALVSLISRKSHGSSGTFDINLLTQTECRTGGGSGNYQLIATFTEPVSVSGVTVTSIDTLATATQSASGTTVTIDLAAVAGAQRAQITLLGVSNGTSVTDVVLSLPVLIGDTTGNGSVTASDIGQAKAQSGQPVSAANFRSDATANGGSINASDIGLVKSRAGSQLPP